MNRRDFISLALGSGLLARVQAAEPSPRLRVGIIGHSGRGDYGHGLDQVWNAFPETVIAAVADADPRGLAAAQKRLKLDAGFASYREMLAKAQPDLVAVCPRHIDQHRDMLMAAIESGARGIYVEKPFCRTPAEADEIVAACERRNTKLAIAHRNRYHPALPMVRKLIDDGAIGRLLEIRSRGKEDRRGGVLDLWVLGSHLFNLMHYFGGEPRACAAQLLKGGKPTTAADLEEGAEGVGPVAGDELHARFELASGVPAFFESIREADKASENYGLQLVGARGVISLRIDKHPIAHLIEGPPWLPPAQPRAWIPISSAGAGVAEPIADAGNLVGSHRLAVQDLLAAIRENREPLCGPRDGRVVVEMTMAVLASHQRGGARVAWPLTDRGNPLAAAP